MSWAEKFPAPIGPVPPPDLDFVAGVPSITDPAWSEYFKMIREHDRWIDRWRRNLVALAIDEIIAGGKELGPADTIVMIMGVDWLERADAKSLPASPFGALLGF